MKKTLKKSLTLIMTLILLINAALFVQASDNLIGAEVLEKDAVEAIALEGINYKSQVTTLIDDVYSDGVYYNNKDVFKAISTVTLSDGTPAVYVTYVDKTTGMVYYRTADFLFDTVTALNPLNHQEAYEYAVRAMSVNEADMVILTNEAEVTADGLVVYHFEFSENIYELHECYVVAESGLIDKIIITKPSGFIDRIVVLIRVLIANLLSNFTRI